MAASRGHRRFALRVPDAQNTMNKNRLPQPLRGIIPPMVTPLRGRDELDVAGLERLIEHILAGGIHGLFILGTTGEAPSLSHRLRHELIERTCRQVAGRVPVLVGITDTAFVECLSVARTAAETGADAVVVSAPYYFPAGQPELQDYLDHLVAELPLPLFLYNMPSHTKLTFEPETVRRAMDQPKVVGLKDSSYDMPYFHDLCALLPARPDWTLLIGPEELLAEGVLLGGHGGVCGGANLCPRLYVELYEAARDRRIDRMLELHHAVHRLIQTVYSVGQHRSSFIKSLKCALSCLGICDDFLAEPFRRFRPEQRAQVQQHLEEAGITPAHPMPSIVTAG